MRNRKMRMYLKPSLVQGPWKRTQMVSIMLESLTGMLYYVMYVCLSLTATIPTVRASADMLSSRSRL